MTKRYNMHKLHTGTSGPKYFKIESLSKIFTGPKIFQKYKIFKIKNISK